MLIYMNKITGVSSVGLGAGIRGGWEELYCMKKKLLKNRFQISLRTRACFCIHYTIVYNILYDRICAADVQGTFESDFKTFRIKGFAPRGAVNNTGRRASLCNNLTLLLVVRPTHSRSYIHFMRYFSFKGFRFFKVS